MWGREKKINIKIWVHIFSTTTTDKQKVPFTNMCMNLNYKKTTFSIYNPSFNASCFHCCQSPDSKADFKSQCHFNPLPTIKHDCNVTLKTIIIMSGTTVRRMCCVFRITCISPIVKQLQTSGKKQWSTLGFVQLCCSFEAYHYIFLHYSCKLM